MRKLFTLLIVMFLWAGSSWAQSTYTFASAAGSYTALSTETVLWSGTFDESVSTAITIPSFTFAGTAYTTMYVTSNGFLTLGTTAPTTYYYTPISGTGAYSASISPFGGDLVNAGSGSPKISYNTNDGGDIVVQWQAVRKYGSSYTTHIVSVQARLNPTTGTIKFVYGGTITATSGSTTFQVGLRGTSNTAYNNRTTLTDWSATTAGGTNAATCTFGVGVIPVVGLTYTFSPPVSGTPLPPTTPSPADAATGVATSGTTTWTFGANTTTYDLKFGPTGSMTQVVTGAAAGATGSYPYSGLSNNTVYQ